MRLETASGTIVFEDYGFIPTIVDYQQVPPRRVRKESVIGKDGDLTFLDGFNNRTIGVRFIVTGGALTARRSTMREITPHLIEGGKLIINPENDIYWKVRVLGDDNITFNYSYDELEILFDAEPTAYSVIDGSVYTWEDADISWGLADLRWDGEDLVDTFDSGTHTLYNRGNYEALPVIDVAGAGTVTIGAYSFTVTEAVTVDCARFVVYSGSTNKMTAFSGDFPVIAPGANTLTTDVTITVNDKDRWV